MKVDKICGFDQYLHVKTRSKGHAHFHTDHFVVLTMGITLLYAVIWLNFSQTNMHSIEVTATPKTQSSPTGNGADDREEYGRYAQKTFCIHYVPLKT